MPLAENNNKNVFVQARDVVDISIRLLQRELTIANLFFKDSGIDWKGRPNDTVTVRVEQPLSAARKFGTGWRPNADVGPYDVAPASDTGAAYDPYGDVYGARPAIRVDTVSETTVTVTIDEFIYKALGVTIEDLTLSTDNFVRANLPKMVRVVADRIEAKCLARLAATHWNDGTNGGAATNFTEAYASATDSDANATQIVAAINKMRRALNANFVPLQGRTLIVGTDIEDKLILSDKFQRVDSVGNADALREATTGRILGNDVVVNATIGADEMYLLSNNAYILSTVTPRQPEGAVQSGVQSGNGLSLMYVQDYDTLHMIDRVSASLFAGTSAVEDGPVVSAARTMVRAAHYSFTAAE